MASVVSSVQHGYILRVRDPPPDIQLMIDEALSACDIWDSYNNASIIMSAQAKIMFDYAMEHMGPTEQANCTRFQSLAWYIEYTGEDYRLEDKAGNLRAMVKQVRRLSTDLTRKSSLEIEADYELRVVSNLMRDRYNILNDLPDTNRTYNTRKLIVDELRELNDRLTVAQDHWAYVTKAPRNAKLSEYELSMKTWCYVLQSRVNAMQMDLFRKTRDVLDKLHQYPNSDMPPVEHLIHWMFRTMNDSTELRVRRLAIMNTTRGRATDPITRGQRRVRRRWARAGPNDNALLDAFLT